MMMVNLKAMIVVDQEIGTDDMITHIAGDMPDTQWWLLTVRSI